MSIRNGISVYHEGLTEPFENVVAADGKDLYQVRRGRYGGWRDYQMENRVLWSGYRYGKSSGGVDVETFCGMVCGIDMPVPGSYGTMMANWTRIDICGKRPLSAIYRKDKEKNPELADRLYNSFDYVVRYYADDEAGFLDGRTIGYVVQGGMYADINWHAVLDGNDLNFVEFVGTPASVEDFLTSRWVQVTGDIRDLTSHLWATSINNPRSWKDAFCEANDAFDVYMSDWVDGADVVLSAAELIAPAESDLGVIAGICLVNGTRPQLRLLVETPRPMSLDEFAEFMTGSVSETKVVIGDDSVRLFIEDVSGVSVTPVFHGTMKRYSELYYGRT